MTTIAATNITKANASKMTGVARGARPPGYANACGPFR